MIAYRSQEADKSYGTCQGNQIMAYEVHATTEGVKERGESFSLIKGLRQDLTQAS